MLRVGTLLGALNFINGVDFVPFLGFTVVLLGLGELRGTGRLPGKVGRWLLQSAALAVAAKLVYAFYSTNYATMVKAKPVENLEQVPVIGWLSQYIGLSLTNYKFKRISLAIRPFPVANSHFLRPAGGTIMAGESAGLAQLVARAVSGSGCKW